MSAKGHWTMAGVPLDSNGIPLKPEWFCPNCTVWYATRGTKFCPTCDGVLDRVPAWLYKMDKAISEQESLPSLEEHLRHLKGQIRALEGQTTCLETQRRHLLGQVRAIDEWLKYLRGGAVERDAGRSPEDTRLLAKARRYGLDTFQLSEPPPSPQRDGESEWRDPEGTLRICPDVALPKTVID